MPVLDPPRPSALPRSGRRSRLLLAAIAALAALLGLILGLLLLPAGTADQHRRCTHEALPGAFTGPGSLGGIAGTGLTRAQIETVRSASPYRGTLISAG